MIDPVGVPSVPEPVIVTSITRLTPEASEIVPEEAAGVVVTFMVDAAVPASDTHAFTTLATFSDPRPVARLNPAVAL